MTPLPLRPLPLGSLRSAASSSRIRYSLFSSSSSPVLSLRRCRPCGASFCSGASQVPGTLRPPRPALASPLDQSSFPHSEGRQFSTESAGANEPDTYVDGSGSRLSVAIVGAGPAGFYSAKYLRSALLRHIGDGDKDGSDGDNNSIGWRGWTGLDVDVIERLPAPYGLVRYGVAPDHPEVKNVQNDFAALFQDETHGFGGGHDEVDSPSSISYFGNVNVGKDVSLAALQSMYHVVILAYGCQADRPIDLPIGDGADSNDGGGASLKGVMSAREFVAWYNGHPDFAHVGDIVEECLWSSRNDKSDDGTGTANGDDSDAVSPAHVAVIGMGNVALDCARILAKGRPSLWTDSDTPTSVLRVLRGGVKKVSVLGRRGHVQGAFTIKELRELTKLRKEGCDTDLVVRKDELDLGRTPASLEELKGLGGRPKNRIDKLLYSAAETTTDGDKDGSAASKEIHLRFLTSPVGLEMKNDGSSGSDDNGYGRRRVGSVLCERTELTGEAGQQRAVGTNEIETVQADLVLASIGYRGLPLEGMDDSSFDVSRGTIAHDNGKVRCSVDSNDGNGSQNGGNLFAAGWIKRGPSGIVGTNIGDAKDTVATVLKCLESGAISINDNMGGSKPGRKELARHLSSGEVRAVSWNDFLRIDQAEQDAERVRSEDQPREKFLSVEDMLRAIETEERSTMPTR